MDDLNYYIQESGKALETINVGLKNKLTALDFQLLIAKKLGYSDEESIKIPNHRLTAEQMIAMMDANDLEKPTKLGLVKLGHSILPEGVPIRLDEKKVKVSGEIWIINKFDKDPFPSNPHGHNVETGYKLHLGNGELFDSKNKTLNATIAKKDLLAIRGKCVGFSLPALTV